VTLLNKVILAGFLSAFPVVARPLMALDDLGGRNPTPAEMQAAMKTLADEQRLIRDRQADILVLTKIFEISKISEASPRDFAEILSQAVRLTESQTHEVVDGLENLSKFTANRQDDEALPSLSDEQLELIALVSDKLGEALGDESIEEPDVRSELTKTLTRFKARLSLHQVGFGE